MTVDKSKEVVIPVWLISAILSLLISVMSAWAIITNKTTSLDLRATHNEANIKTLQDSKVGKDEFGLVYDKLKDIELKLDKHIELN